MSKNWYIVMIGLVLAMVAFPASKLIEHKGNQNQEDVLIVRDIQKGVREYIPMFVALNDPLVLEAAQEELENLDPIADVRLLIGPRIKSQIEFSVPAIRKTDINFKTFWIVGNYVAEEIRIVSDSKREYYRHWNTHRRVNAFKDRFERIWSTAQ